MAHKRKDALVAAPQWWRHLRPFEKRASPKRNLTQRRIKARKASACGLCKPWKQGWADKKTVRDIRHAQRAQQQLAEISQ